MQKTDRLYEETRLRVGTINMEGVDQLLENGHTGLAEKHTVSKLISYVQSLEDQLGVEVRTPETVDRIKVNNGTKSFFL